jgi:hypothetical protein
MSTLFLMGHRARRNPIFPHRRWTVPPVSLHRNSPPTMRYLPPTSPMSSTQPRTSLTPPLPLSVTRGAMNATAVRHHRPPHHWQHGVDHLRLSCVHTEQKRAHMELTEPAGEHLAVFSELAPSMNITALAPLANGIPLVSTTGRDPAQSAPRIYLSLLCHSLLRSNPRSSLRRLRHRQPSSTAISCSRTDRLARPGALVAHHSFWPATAGPPLGRAG